MVEWRIRTLVKELYPSGRSYIEPVTPSVLPARNVVIAEDSVKAQAAFESACPNE